MRLKEALVKHGYITADQNTRGRPSRQFLEWGQEIVDKGLETIDTITPSKGTAASKPAAVSPKPIPKTAKGGIVDIPDVFRDEAMWTAMAGGKEIGFRTVENQCGNSLGWCRCATPKVWVNHSTEGVVTFKPKRGAG